MKVLEDMQEILALVRSGLDSFNDALASDHWRTPDTHEMLIEIRQLHRLCDFATARLLRQLQLNDDLRPRRRSDKNQLLHRYKFTCSELNQLLSAANSLFTTPPSIGVPEGKPAKMPTTAGHLENAETELASCEVIARTLDVLPSTIPPETACWVEQTLANLSTELCPDDLKKAAQKVLQGLALDDAPADESRQKQRGASLSQQDETLMSGLKVRATPELDALLRRLFADYAGPGDLLAEHEKENDTRTADQRRHDALVAALKYAVNRTGPMPPTRGCASVVVSMTREQLAAASGVATTDVGTILPIPDLLRLGADRDGFLALLDENTGNLIELGRTRRQADMFAYIGLVASQGGDQTPGSDLPAAMCEIHHIDAWSRGGLSEADNLALVGHNTHRNIDDSRQDPKKWHTYTTKDGYLLWRPPDRIDPQRRPCMNFHPWMWLVPGQLIKYERLAA